nr:hypothetical protein [Angustibacter aerolatus]
MVKGVTPQPVAQRRRPGRQRDLRPAHLRAVLPGRLDRRVRRRVPDARRPEDHRRRHRARRGTGAGRPRRQRHLRARPGRAADRERRGRADAGGRRVRRPADDRPRPAVQGRAGSSRRR